MFRSIGSSTEPPCISRDELQMYIQLLNKSWRQKCDMTAYSTLLMLSSGLELESPSQVNFTFGIRFEITFRESIESRPESSFSCTDDEAELSVWRSDDIGQSNAFPSNLFERRKET